MKIIVVDASVILRFLLEENVAIKKYVESMLRSAEKRKISLICAPLLPLEIANGLRFTLKDMTIAGEVFAQFSKLPIEIVPLTAVQVAKSLEISYSCRTTVYDASYHVLAIVRNGLYVTADREYADKAKRLGHIQLL